MADKKENNKGITSGVDLASLLDVSPEQLAALQYDALKGHAISRLKKVISLLEDNHLCQIEGEMKYSPAGGAYGGDNHYVDFSWCESQREHGRGVDLLEVVIDLMRLQNQI